MKREMKQEVFDLVLMTPTSECAKIVHHMRNDPDALRMSFDSTAHSFEIFYKKFLLDYFLLKDLPSLFACQDGKKIAYIRFRPFIGPSEGKKCAEISINVAQEYRGIGVGPQLLKQMNEFAKRQGYESLWAEIKPDNMASQKAFLAAGYKFYGNATHEATIQGRQSICDIKLYCLNFSQKTMKKTFVIAEAGSNWRLGDLESDLSIAKSLIEAASDAGCDAIKFQTFQAGSLYVPNPGMAPYLARMGHRDDIVKTLQRMTMPHEAIERLAFMCKKARIEFMSTAFSPKDFKAIDPYVKRHKIASYEIGHIHLLELAAKSKKPLILSTGASTISDIAWSIDFFRQASKALLTLLQCTAHYPASDSAMHLRSIPWMKSYFQLPCGLSDHSLDPLSAPLGAVALGASIIEKHVTLDRRLPGPDQCYAIEPHELKIMVSHIRQLEEMLGDAVKKVDPEEEELFFFAKRAIQAIKPIAKGDLLREGKNIAILRPGNQKKGVHPKFLYELVGKRATRNIAIGDGIQFEDWEQKEIK